MAYIKVNVVDIFLQRVREVTDLKTQKEIATVLAVDPSTISTAKKRGKVPSRWAYLLADKYGLRAEWLLTGQGEASSGGVMIAGQPFDALHPGRGRDPNMVAPQTLPLDSVAALVWKQEQLLADVGMKKEEIIVHVRATLAAHAAQLRKQREEEHDYHVGETRPDYGQVHEKPADWPSKSPKDPNDDSENDKPLPNHTD